MALAHTRLKMLSRRDGNTVARLAYRSGTKLLCGRTGKIFNYTHKEVQSVILCLPKDAPAWAKTWQQEMADHRARVLQAFSDLAESHEKRWDAQVYREYEFALPRELTAPQAMAMAKALVQEQMCALGMTALLNFHLDKDPQTQERKYHCHVVLLTRRLTEDGLSPLKERAWNDRSLGWTFREQFAAYTNFHLALHGHGVRIDPRSYAEQGCPLEPEPKRGSSEHQGQRSMKDRAFQRIRLRNLYRLIADPHLVFDRLIQQKTTFGWKEVEALVHGYVDNTTVAKALCHRLRLSPNLMVVREKTEASPALYTTRSLLVQEQAVIKLAQEITERTDHGVSSLHRDRALDALKKRLEPHGGITADQERAFHHVLSPESLRCLVGYAGAGKTTLLQGVKDAWQWEGYGVHGLAPTGRAAQNLREAGIPSQTLHGFLKNLEQGRCRYHPRTVLVLDEAAMVDGRRFHALLQAVKNLKIKLVAIGDGEQLQPIDPGVAFDLITRSATPVLHTVVRQDSAWQRHATQLFGQGQGRQALALYDHHGHVTYVTEGHSSDPRAQTKDTLIAAWAHSQILYEKDTHVILAHTNRDIQDLNRRAREHLWVQGKLTGPQHTYTTVRETTDEWGKTHRETSQKAFAVGDRLLFLKNNHTVQNGLMGTVTHLTQHAITVQMEGRKDPLTFRPALYPHFDHGYAITIHKSQGTTVDRTFVLGSRGLHDHVTYVALSRHKKDMRLFVGSKDVPSPQHLGTLGRSMGHKPASDTLDPQELQRLLIQHRRPLQRALTLLGHQMLALKAVSQEAWHRAAQSFTGQCATPLPLSLSPASQNRWKDDQERFKEPTAETRRIQYRDPLTYYDAHTVMKSLTPASMEQLFEAHITQWVPKPKKSRSGPHLRYGGSGGFVIDTQRGLWFNHYGGESGNLFHYIAQSRDLSYKEAVTWVGTWAGSPETIYQTPEQRQRSLKQAHDTRVAEEAQRRQKAQHQARALWHRSQPLSHTLAQTYLQDHRGIQTPLPEDLRFHGACPTEGKILPALLAFARDQEGTPTAYQAIYLDPLTAHKTSTLKAAKKTHGVIKGSAVIIQQDPHQSITYVAEGLETALSLKEAGLQGTILASLGQSNMAHVPVTTNTVVLCGDYDGANHPRTHKAITKIAQAYEDKGHEVILLYPPTTGAQKTDFNDILKDHGRQYLNRYIQKTMKEETHTLVMGLTP